MALSDRICTSGMFYTTDNYFVNGINKIRNYLGIPPINMVGLMMFHIAASEIEIQKTFNASSHFTLEGSLDLIGVRIMGNCLYFRAKCSDVESSTRVHNMQSFIISTLNNKQISCFPSNPEEYLRIGIATFENPIDCNQARDKIQQLTDSQIAEFFYCVDSDPINE